MSKMDEQIMEATKELGRAQQKLGVAGAHLAVHMSVCLVLATEDTQSIRLRAIKALTKGAERYAAGTLALADQMKAELRGLTQ